jgi:hypothetical protein
VCCGWKPVIYLKESPCETEDLIDDTWVHVWNMPCVVSSRPCCGSTRHSFQKVWSNVKFWMLKILCSPFVQLNLFLSKNTPVPPAPLFLHHSAPCPSCWFLCVVMIRLIFESAKCGLRSNRLACLSRHATRQEINYNTHSVFNTVSQPFQTHGSTNWRKLHRSILIVCYASPLGS